MQFKFGFLKISPLFKKQKQKLNLLSRFYFLKFNLELILFKFLILIRFLIFLHFEEHVAQSVEHLTFNEVVVGSIPTVLTIII